MPERKTLLIRVDPAVHEALVRWAADELRSTTAHVSFSCAVTCFVRAVYHERR